MHADDGYIEIEQFAADHWSTLAYAETVMVENGGFQVGFDGRMRQGRRHFRVMMGECPRPKRQNHAGPSAAVIMKPEYATKLADGTQVEAHDDWHCVQDLVYVGLMGIERNGLIVPAPDDITPGVVLKLTPLGERCVSELRRHKTNGGTFATFHFTPEPVT